MAQKKTRRKKYNYMETRKAVKDLILKVGVDGVYNYHINKLMENGHLSENIINAIDYFRYSPQTAKYRVKKRT